MPERLTQPIENKGVEESQRIADFAGYIRGVYAGEGMPFQLPANILQKQLETGNEVREYSYTATDSLFRRIKPEERPLFLQAIGTLIEDPQTPQYTIAALLNHATLENFIDIVDPSIMNLFLENTPKIEVLAKALQLYSNIRYIHSRMPERIEPSPQTVEKVWTKRDYRITKKEREMQPTLSRKFVEGWVIDHVPNISVSYNFYPFGKAPELKSIALNLEFFSDDKDKRFLMGTWYDAHTLEDFLPVGNLFLQSVLPEEEKQPDYETQRERQPGIYIMPDHYTRVFSEEGIHIPFSDQAITKEMLEAALRANSDYVNYSIDECGIDIFTAGGNILNFYPHIPNDRVRHPIDPSFPPTSHYYLQLNGPISSDLVPSLISANNKQGLPVKEIGAILR